METGNPITRRLYNRAKGVCVWCREHVPFEIATLEHILPRSKGGTDALSNLTMACCPCNRARGDRISGPDPERVNQLRANAIASLRKSRANNPVHQRRALKRKPSVGERIGERRYGPARAPMAQMVPIEIWEELLAPRPTLR